MSVQERVARHFAELGETLMGTLGMNVTEMTPERVTVTMPVTPTVHQPYGLLHGGASVALAETIASIGAWLNVDPDEYWAVGQEINANHIRSMRSGTVTGVGIPLHVGKTSQVWDVKLFDEQQRLVCVSRCTMAIVPIAGRTPPTP